MNPFAGIVNAAGMAAKKARNPFIEALLGQDSPPMGGSETAAPRMDSTIPEHPYKNTPQSLVGGATPIESVEEDNFLRNRGMIRKNDFSWKDRLKESGINALAGGMQGLAATGRGEGGLAGAATGGAVGAYDPRLGARMQYEMAKPAMREQSEFDARQEDRGFRRSQAEAALRNMEADNQRSDRHLGLAEGQDRRETERHSAAMRSLNYKDPDPKRYVIDGALVDPAGKVLYQGQGRSQSPLSMDEAESIRSALEGSTSKIAADSMKGREAALRQKLPKVYQDALSNPNSVDTETYDKARKAWDQLYSDEQKRVESYTENEAKRKNNSRRFGMTSGRPIGDVLNRYPILQKKFGGR